MAIRAETVEKVKKPLASKSAILMVEVGGELRTHGMLASTLIAILLVPVYFMLMQSPSDRLRKRKKQVSERGVYAAPS